MREIRMSGLKSRVLKRPLYRGNAGHLDSTEMGKSPFYYSEAMNTRDIPGVLFEQADSMLGLKSTALPGYAALALVSPKLTHAQHDALRPIMRMLGLGLADPYDHDYALKMAAANSRELLAAQEANKGRPLRPEQIWRTVIGDKAPKGLTADNLGRLMFDTATARLFQRVQATFPHYTPDQMKNMIQFELNRGIPFQTLFKAYQPGGRLSLEDMRFGVPTISSLLDYTPENAYGLVTDFGRRQCGI